MIAADILEPVLLGSLLILYVMFLVAGWWFVIEQVKDRLFFDEKVTAMITIIAGTSLTLLSVIFILVILTLIGV